MHKFIKLLLIGILVGISIGLFFSLFMSWIFGNGFYFPSSIAFCNRFQTTLGAMSCSAFLWALTGCMFSFTSQIYVVTDWSVTKMTVTHFILTLCLFTPISLIAGWFPLHIISISIFIIIFVIIYLILWFIFMWITLKEIDALNKQIKK